MATDPRRIRPAVPARTPLRHLIGARRACVIVADDAVCQPQACVDIAAGMAPFPAEGATHYPGLRRIIGPADTRAQTYVAAVLAVAAPLIREAYGAADCELTEAGFSLVTRRPQDLMPSQRIPHYDSAEPGFIAILHYLSDIADTGTCFYRHRTTGFERITRHDLPVYNAVLDFEGPPQRQGFIGESDARYEQLLRVDGRFNRLLIYESALLHSGFIPDDFAYSADPRVGRLTGNLFVRLR